METSGEPPLSPGTEPPRRSSCAPVVVAVVVAVVVLCCVYSSAERFLPAGEGDGSGGGGLNLLSPDAQLQCPDPGYDPELAAGYPFAFSLDPPDGRDGVVKSWHSTEQVDPLVTGQLYEGARASGAGRRFVFGGRIAYGKEREAWEAASSTPGEVGADVGPLGLCPTGPDGKPDVFDDGIPVTWQMPSTPVNWYRPIGPDSPHRLPRPRRGAAASSRLTRFS